MELPASYLKEQLSLEQVLAENDFEAATRDYREDWDRLQAKMLPGDQLWRVEPPQGAIRVWGIALVRSGRVISTLIEAVD